LEVLTTAEHLEINDFSSARQAAWAIAAIAAEIRHPAGANIFDVNTSDPLSLQLPSGPRESVMDNLRHWLPAAAKYDPAWFKSELSTMQQK
jgi:hypothetical protein